MKRQQWIEVVGWDKFQHYRNRRPLWIKNYTDLLAKPEYLRLTPTQRALLHGLWMIYAASERSVPLRPEIVNRWLGLSAKIATFKALNDAGFIRFVASKPLAQRKRERKRTSNRGTKAVDNGPAELEQLAYPEWLATLEQKAKT